MRRLAGLAEQTPSDHEAAIAAICAAAKDAKYVEWEIEDDLEKGEGENTSREAIEKHLSKVTGFPVKVTTSKYTEETGNIEVDEPDYDDRDEGKIQERRGYAHAEVSGSGHFAATVGGKEIARGEFSIRGDAPASPGSEPYFDRSFGNWLPGDDPEVRTDEAEFTYLYVYAEPTGGC